MHPGKTALWGLIFVTLTFIVFGAPPRVVEMKAAEADVKLSEDDLKPPDHLDAVKLEQDGMINKDFHKEVFLGNHEEIDDDQPEIAEGKLKEIFMKIDADFNDKLCVPEVAEWIHIKTQEHFDEGMRDNEHIFKHMDPDGDGLVDWKEYYMHFMLAKGYSADKAKKHVEDYDIEMDQKEKDQLIRYKFKWTDADIDPIDNKLSKKEFLAFRHPEQSEQAMSHMVKTIMESLDRNKDGVLTEEEFTLLPPGVVEDEGQKQLDVQWQEERREEFRSRIDADHDGNVTSNDLMKYIDPRNKENTVMDARNIISQMDDNKDSCLSWKEVEDHKNEFIQSKVVNVRKILHDEF